MSGPAILKRWRLALSLPWGRALFSFILSFFVPYASTIRPRIELLEPGRARGSIKQYWGIKNHIGTIHAVALANLGELVGNLALQALEPPHGRWIVRGLEIDYIKKARGRIEATCVIDDDINWSIDHDRAGRVELRDESGDLVVVVRPQWRIGPRPQGAPAKALPAQA